MISIHGVQIKPTIFPDGTSQIWKIPEEVLQLEVVDVVWNFESEREIVDLYSLRTLVGYNTEMNLHLPYLPYGRQDKPVSNQATFNLFVFGNLLNTLKLNSVTTVDAHNPVATAEFIKNFKNISVTNLHQQVISTFQPDTIAFPDAGAYNRYGETFHGDYMIFDKHRNQSTGVIEGHKISGGKYNQPHRILIVDDLCDGGATFISVAKAIHSEINSNIEVGLYVTHGVFSRGKDHLLNNGIAKIFTTNSLLKNAEGFKV